MTAFRGTDCGFNPVTQKCEWEWRNFYDQAIWSSPVVVDLDGNGVKEVVVGSGCYFSPETRGRTGSKFLTFAMETRFAR